MAQDKTLQVRIHTPEGTVYDETVNSVVLPGELGQFGVLYNHIPYMSLLDTGPIVLKTGDRTDRVACGGGFAEIEENVVTVLAETAERPEEIDRGDVEERVEDLTSMLKSGEGFEDEVERQELESELRRAKVRLKVLEEDE